MTSPLWKQVQDADVGIPRGFIALLRDFEENGRPPQDHDAQTLVRRLHERQEPTLALAVSRLLGGLRVAP